MKVLFLIFLFFITFSSFLFIKGYAAETAKIETRREKLIGHIIHQNGVHACNFFATAENEIMTAGHCVIGRDLKLVIPYKKFVNTRNPSFIDVKIILSLSRIFNIKASNWGYDDWALIKIDNDDPYKKIDLRIFKTPPKNSEMPMKFQVAGYDKKKRLIIRNCSLDEDGNALLEILGVGDKVFALNCDGEIEKGMSGAPVYSNDVVWGILTARFGFRSSRGFATKIRAIPGQ